MTGKELTDRLIQDIIKSSETRKKVPDSLTQVKLLGLTGKSSPNDFSASLDARETDLYLDNLSEFINLSEKLVEHSKGEKVDVNIFIRDIISNREKIGHVFQQILDNKGLLDIGSFSSVSEFLLDQLEEIHKIGNRLYA